MRSVLCGFFFFNDIGPGHRLLLILLRLLFEELKGGVSFVMAENQGRILCR